MIVHALKAPLALVIFSWRPSCTLPLLFILENMLRHKIHFLVVVVNQVDTVNTTIVMLDPLLLLDTHSHKVLKCALNIGIYYTFVSYNR
jgi:hypothetical protein